MKDNLIIIIQIAISIVGCFAYSFFVNKIRKKETRAVYDKTIKSNWAKKGIIASIVNATLFCLPFVLFILYNAGIISMASLCCFSIVIIIAASIMLFFFLVPLLRKWSGGTVRTGDEYIEVFDAKNNKRTNFKWTEIEWISGTEEKNTLQIYVENRIIELKNVSTPGEIIAMYHQKCR